MNELIESMVFEQDGVPVTTSLKVAEYFKKNHFDVLKSIKILECSKEFTDRNFAVSEYKDSTGRKLPMYYITRDGFMFLCMGYTGPKAAKIKEDYIKAFNCMEEYIHTQTIPITVVDDWFKINYKHLDKWYMGYMRDGWRRLFKNSKKMNREKAELLMRYDDQFLYQKEIAKLLDVSVETLRKFKKAQTKIYDFKFFKEVQEPLFLKQAKEAAKQVPAPVNSQITGGEK
jgi:Rha family phage regulatory protein